MSCLSLKLNGEYPHINEIYESSDIDKLYIKYIEKKTHSTEFNLNVDNGNKNTHSMQVNPMVMCIWFNFHKQFTRKIFNELSSTQCSIKDMH